LKLIIFELDIHIKIGRYLSHFDSGLTQKNFGFLFSSLSIMSDFGASHFMQQKNSRFKRL